MRKNTETQGAFLMPDTVRGRLLLYLILALVPLSSLSLSLAIDEGSEEEARARAEYSAAARLAGAELDGVFRLSRGIVAGLRSSASDSALCDSLAAWKKSFPQFRNIGLIKLDFARHKRSEVCSAEASPAPDHDLSPDEAWIALDLAGEGSPAVASIRWIDGHAVVPVAACMPALPGATRRIVTAQVDLAWLNARLNRIPIPAGSELAVLDPGGLVAARNPVAAEFPPGSDASAFERSLLARGDFDGETNSYQVLTKTLPAAGMTVILKIPVWEIFRRSRTRLALHIGGLLAVTTSIFCLAWVSSHRSLIRPLHRVGDVADRLAAGDLSARTGLEYRGDIGRLARSFDVMAAFLQRETLGSAQMLDSLRALTARLDSLAEEERTRISREIHDELGQQLTAIRFELDALLRHPDPDAAAKAHDAVALIDAAFKEVRRIATELRPSALDYGCLGGSLEVLAAEFERRTSIRCSVLLPADVAVPGPAATCLFRICQESLTNIGRHSGATSVELHLTHDAEGLTLTVRDNGRGFVYVDSPETRSLGLLGMRERARIAGGTLTIETAPGQGAAIIAHIPLSS